MSSWDYIQRNKWVKKTKFENYDQLIKSKDWIRFKKALQESDPRYCKCRYCGRSPVHIHHKRYTKRFFVLFNKFCLGGYSLNKGIKKELIPLCFSCHYKVHAKEKEGYTINKATKKYKSLCKRKKQKKYT